MNIIKYLTDRARIRPMCAICLVALAFGLLSLYLSERVSSADVAKYTGAYRIPVINISDGDLIEARGKIVSLAYTEVRYYGSEPVSMLEVMLNDVDVSRPGRPQETYSYAAFRKIKVLCSADEELYMGQRIGLKGRLKYYERAANPGQYDAYGYNETKDTLFSVNDAVVTGRSKGYSYTGQALLTLRLKGEAVLSDYLDTDDAAIIKAMLFGNKKELSSDVKEMFRKNGIAHILAISGLHISFLAMLFYKLLGFLNCPVWLRAVISEAAIVTYGFLVGYTPSAFRAICMFSLFLISKILLRAYDMLSAMAFALVLVAIFKPRLLSDTGLMLSFGAVFGVGYFYRSFDRNILGMGRFFSAIGVSCAVFLTTLPCLLCTYYEAAFYSVFLNIVIIPLMSVLLVSAVMLVLTGVWCPFAGKSAAFIIKAILWLYKYLCSMLSTSPLKGSNIGAPKCWQIVIFYMLLVAAVNLKGKYRRYIASGLIVLSVFLLVIRPFKGMDVWMLDIGQGDCMLIRTSDSYADMTTHTVIIDCGSSSVNGVGSKRLIPALKYCGTDVIDAVFITHPDADHINGINELLTEAYDENIRIEKVYVYKGFVGSEGLGQTEELIASMTPSSTGKNDHLTELVNKASKEAPKGDGILTGLTAGDTLQLGGLTFSILHPVEGFGISDPNEASLVMDIKYGRYHILTTGDAGALAEAEVMAHHDTPSYRYDLLKVGHHGSSTSSTPTFLNWADPVASFISCGRDNPYGHPHEETLEALTLTGSDIYRTDESGAIMLHTDGRKAVVRTFLGSGKN